MNRIEDQLKELHDIHLPQEVSIRMREELVAYANLHTESYSTHVSRNSGNGFIFSRLFTGVLAILVIVFGVTGTVHAAGKSLPGDTLYPLKVHVAEPVQAALIPDSHGKAAWHAIIAERRLNEAAQLAAENRLSSTTQAQLALSFTEHVDASENNAQQLQEHGDTIGALAARSDLDARLVAHGHILSVIADHFAQASTTQESEAALSIHTLVQMVQEREQDVAEARLALEEAISPGTASSTARVALGTSSNADTSRSARAHIRGRLMHNTNPSLQIEQANAQRSEEVQNILTSNATLLAKFLPHASTTATSSLSITATSTATSTTNTTSSSTPVTASTTQNTATTSENSNSMKVNSKGSIFSR